MQEVVEPFDGHVDHSEEVVEEDAEVLHQVLLILLLQLGLRGRQVSACGQSFNIHFGNMIIKLNSTNGKGLTVESCLYLIKN